MSGSTPIHPRPIVYHNQGVLACGIPVCRSPRHEYAGVPLAVSGEVCYTNGAMDYVYTKSACRRPHVRTESIERKARFYEDCVEASGTLYGRVRKALNDVESPACGTEV